MNMAPIELPSSDNPYAAPQHTALIAAEESQSRPATPTSLLRTVILWLVVCSAGATPSFMLGMTVVQHPWRAPAMVVAVLLFAAACIAVDRMAVSACLAQYPRFRSAVRASYGIRVAISVMLPIGFAIDMFCGILSVGFSQLFFGSEDTWSVPAIMVTVFVQGILLTALVWAIVPVIYAVQLIFWKAPDSPEPAEPPPAQASPQ
ncbi:MAG: hypothetical protein U0795_25260 [Pirellulales bacterium]